MVLHEIANLGPSGLAGSIPAVGVENNPLVFHEVPRETCKSFDLLFFDFPQIAKRRFQIASEEIAKNQPLLWC